MLVLCTVFFINCCVLIFNNPWAAIWPLAKPWLKKLLLEFSSKYFQIFLLQKLSKLCPPFLERSHKTVIRALVHGGVFKKIMGVFLKKSYGGVFFNFFMEVLSDFFYWNLIKAGELAVPHNWSGKAKPLSNTFIIYIFYLYFIIYNWSGKIKQLSNIIFSHCF